MVTEDDVRKQLKRAFKSEIITVLAEIKGVNQSERTCDIDDDGVMIYGVRLQCITNGSCGVVITPKLGSKVLCVKIEDTDSFMVLHASEVEKLEIDVAGKTISADSNGFVFNEGSVGAAKTDKLVEWMTKVYSDLQTLISLLSTSPVAGNGAPLGIAFVPQTPQPELTVFADDKLKH